LKAFSEELVGDDPGQKGDGEKGGKAPASIPALTRDTYRGFQLTRDLLILNGTLEAHFFQSASVLLAVPADVKTFATIFHVECENCSWFYKTISYGQLVEVEPANALPVLAH
jgi:hypothetical protein